jgi:hypothetical protein
MADVLAGAQFDYPDGDHVARASGMRWRCAELCKEAVVQPPAWFRSHLEVGTIERRSCNRARI